MNWPMLVATLVIAAIRSGSGSCRCWLRSSSTAVTSVPTRMGTNTPAWTPSLAATDARRNLESPAASVIHTGSTSSFFVKPADTASVTLNLTSRFAMYEANFNSLPDSISSSTSGTGKDKLNLNPVVLKVDGVIMADSLLASGYFAGNQSVKVFFDYIAPGSHTVTLEAYGVLNTYSGVLYSGVSTFTAVAGVDDTKSLSLNWVGPTTGTGKLTVTLGKVGKVTVNGALPGTVIP